jgi:hypothetical protein
MTEEPSTSDRAPVQDRIAPVAFFTTLAVGALYAIVLGIATRSPSRLTSAQLGEAMLAATLYSTFLTIPGGLLAGAIAPRVARSRCGQRGLAGWLLAGVGFGALTGAACFLVPLWMLTLAAASLEGALSAVVLAGFLGAVPGATTGALVAWYCRRLQRRVRG